MPGLNASRGKGAPPSPTGTLQPPCPSWGLNDVRDVGMLSYGFLWVSCFLARSSQISPQFYQNSPEFKYNLTGVSA